MPTIGQGSKVTIRPDGGKERTYPIAPSGPTVRAHYVRLMKERAWAELDRQRTIVDESRWFRMEETITRDMAAGLYEWGDSIHNRQADNRTGFITDVLARLKGANPDATEADVETIINAVGWKRLSELVREADGPPLPNGQAPASTPSGAGAGESMTKDSSGSSSSASPDRGIPTSSP